MLGTANKRTPPVQGAKYVRAPRPVHFPVEAEVPETKRHLLLRTALFQIVQRLVAGRYAVGSEQFVYWNGSDPQRSLAPDVFVSTLQPDSVFDTWKTWERGAPQLAVEIVSESDSSEGSWTRKLERYQEAGIDEVVRFHPFAEPGRRLRVWDRVDDDLVERVVSQERARCETLDAWWCVREERGLGAALRLSTDAGGQALVLTPAEAAEQEAKLREQESVSREAAERRVAELEAELEGLRRR